MLSRADLSKNLIFHACELVNKTSAEECIAQIQKLRKKVREGKFRNVTIANYGENDQPRVRNKGRIRYYKEN